MTPNPPPPADGSAIPPRQRPNMSALAKDTTEQDLWAFDDPEPAPEGSAEILPPVAPEQSPGKSFISQLNDPRPAKPGGNPENIKVNLGQSKPRIQAGKVTTKAGPGSEFDELESWEGPAVPPTTSSLTSVPPPSDPEPATVQPAKPDSRDEFSPVAPTNAQPVSLRPRLNLTKVERIGLLALVVLLLIGGVMIYFNTISRLPTDSGRVATTDFPIQGKHLTLVSAVTFWRVPKATDTVRRGTQLIPVVDLTASGGPAAVRLLFRNSDGDVIGDAVTRLIRPGSALQIAATAGFDDVGMHAAYRTGVNKPWTIEVFEAATENSPGPEFQKLLEMNVATERR